MKKSFKKTSKQNKALFLDRDGVINKDYGHVHQIDKFHLIENIEILINTAQRNGYKIIIITNQAGIGKKLFSVEDFNKLTKHMKYLFLKYNCHIDAVYHCPFHPSKGVGKYLKDSFDTDMVGPYGYCADISRAFVVGNKFNDEQKNYIQWQLNK